MVVSIRSRKAHALDSENESGRVILTSILLTESKRSSEPHSSKQFITPLFVIREAGKNLNVHVVNKLQYSYTMKILCILMKEQGRSL